MEKLALILALTISLLAGAQQNYNQGMQDALLLMEKGKDTEAVAVFESIAEAEPENWLPHYYIALLHTTPAFETTDTAKFETLLGKSQTALNTALKFQPDNVELLVLQAMVLTARINHDPMEKGPALSGRIMQLFNYASILAPENPRVVLYKALYDMGKARFFGSPTQPICTEFERSVQLFNTFKPETAFHPQWGKQIAVEMTQNCK